MTASFTRSGRAKYDQRLYPLIPDHYCCTYRIMSIKSAYLPIADWSSYSRTRGRVLEFWSSPRAALRSVRASCALFFTCRYIIQTPMALSDSAVSPETLSCKLPVFLLYYLITYIEYLVL